MRSPVYDACLRAAFAFGEAGVREVTVSIPELAAMSLAKTLSDSPGLMGAFVLNVPGCTMRINPLRESQPEESA